MLEYIQPRSLSSCNSIKTFEYSALYTTIPYSKLKDRLRELVQLCFIKKKNGQRRYKYLVIGRHTSYFAKQKHSDSTKRFSETYIINMSEFFLLTTSLLCLVDVFFKRQLTCLWVQTVLLLSPTCSFIRMKQISYRDFSRKTKRS